MAQQRAARNPSHGGGSSRRAVAGGAPHGAHQERGERREWSPAEFARQVQDALAHLYDPVFLQTHPLAERLSRHDPCVPPSRAGRALRQRLVEAIAALRPDAERTRA